MDYNTLELAKIYEAQGYHVDALAVYEALDEKFHGENSEARAGYLRMKEILTPRDSSPVDVAGADHGRNGSESDVEPVKLSPDEKLARCMETWIGLMVTQTRIQRLKGLALKA